VKNWSCGDHSERRRCALTILPMRRGLKADATLDQANKS